MEKKAMKANIRLISSTCFCYYRKHPNNDNKICPLPSSSCFQQHFHDWFYVVRHGSDLWKLEWGLILFCFNCIRDLKNRYELSSIPVAKYSSFLYQARTLKTNLLSVMAHFSKYYLKQAQFASFSNLHRYSPF